MHRILLCSTFLLSVSLVAAQQYTIATIAGTGVGGSSGNGAAAVDAAVQYPQAMVLAADGSLYFGQPADHTIRRIDATTGFMEHVAGTGTIAYNGDGGPAAEAGLAYPFGMAFNAEGDLFIAERDAYRIRRISAADGTISTFAGTMSPGNNTEVPALSASLHAPMGLRFRANGDLLLSVIGNNYVRYIDADSNYLHAFAGSGIAAFSGDSGSALSASFNLPYDIAIASNGDVYIADINNAAIRKVDALSGIITTVAGIGTGPTAYNGDGIPAVEATLGLPQCIALDGGDNLYISDANHSRIRRVDATTGLISTIAGTATPGYNGDGINSATAMLNAPCGIVVDALGRIIFADAANHRIRMLTPVDETGLSDITGSSVQVHAYPSPADDRLNVRVEHADRPTPVELVDATGRIRLRGLVPRDRPLQLEVGSVAPGLYWLRVNGVRGQAIVVRH